MLKSLIYELLKSSIRQEEKSYGKPFVHFFNILGLVLIITANYCYCDSTEFYFLMQSGIVSIISSIVIEAVRCYLKYKNRYRTLDALRLKSSKLVESLSTPFTDLAKLTLCKILNSVKMENGVVVAYNYLTALTLFGKPFFLFYVQFF